VGKFRLISGESRFIKTELLFHQKKSSISSREKFYFIKREPLFLSKENLGSIERKPSVHQREVPVLSK